MKKKISDFVRSLGGSTRYSGHKRIMYIKNDPDGDILNATIKKFGRHFLMTLTNQDLQPTTK